MVTHIHDGHGFIRSKVLRAYRGVAAPPYYVRYVEDQPVITGFLDDSAARASGARIGDVILAIDGQSAEVRFDLLARTIAASTPQGLRMFESWYLLAGPDSSMAEVTVRGADGRSRRLLARRTIANLQNTVNDRPGDILRLLPENIGYVDLERLSLDMVDSMFTMFRETAAIIFDMRGYPQGTAWRIAPRLTEHNDVEAARFSRPIADFPHGSSNTEMGIQSTTFEFTQRLPATDGWRYHGRTVMLIDGRTMSQAEHTGLFFEAANGTVFIGSPTVGANGDVTNFSLPGGIYVSLSGHEVRHADGRQLQRLGLQPDVPVEPTIAGIQAGKDEVLERAIEYLSRPD